MPYFIRVLSPSDQIIAASALSSSLKNATLVIESGTDDSWEQLLLTLANGKEIAVIERNAVREGSMAEEEIAEFMEELDEVKPKSGAEWLRGYLPRIKAMYAFQILGAGDDNAAWVAIGELKGELWNRLGGIFQADGEGFSNEEGYQIVWQFSDGVAGAWWMGLLQDGTWIHFEMDLGNAKQRAQFLDGTVPEGVKFAP
jgi:hypothetical protein